MNVTLPPLPYAVDALEPHLSRRTLSVHHGNHHSAYIAKTRALISTPPESTELEDVVRSSAQNKALFNASAQAWNHAFLWQSMRPGGGGEARGAIAQALEASFGSQRVFSQRFVSAAGDQFGSGWAWLVLENDKLQIVSTSNAGHPSNHRAAAAVDHRCLGARLLSRLPAPPAGLHRGIPRTSRQLGFRQSEPRAASELAIGNLGQPPARGVIGHVRGLAVQMNNVDSPCNSPRRGGKSGGKCGG